MSASIVELTPNADAGAGMTLPMCPAAALAETLAGLEREADALEREIGRTLTAAAFAHDADTLPRLQALEGARNDSLLAADDARTQLSQVEPATCAGAAAQLLAAIRDIRVGDMAEVKRARDLERQARRFFAASGVIAQDSARAISQTSVR